MFVYFLLIADICISHQHAFGAVKMFEKGNGRLKSLPQQMITHFFWTLLVERQINRLNLKISLQNWITDIDINDINQCCVGFSGLLADIVPVCKFHYLIT